MAPILDTLQMVSPPGLVGNGLTVSVRNTFLHCAGTEAADDGLEQPSLWRSKTSPAGSARKAVLLQEEEEDEDVRDVQAPPGSGEESVENRPDAAFPGVPADARRWDGLPDPVVLLGRLSLLGPVQVGAPVAIGPPTKPAAPRQAVRCTQESDSQSRRRTTVMLRNLPNNYTRATLLDLIDGEGFVGRYDFLYLPIDFRTHAALGYAFLNLVTPEDAELLRQRLDGFSRWSLPSTKICSVGWSHPHQGLEPHVARYRNSPLMHEAVPDSYRPALFANGARVPFPPPTKKIKPPRQGTQRVLI